MSYINLLLSIFYFWTPINSTQHGLYLLSVYIYTRMCTRGQVFWGWAIEVRSFTYNSGKYSPNAPVYIYVKVYLYICIYICLFRQAVTKTIWFLNNQEIDQLMSNKEPQFSSQASYYPDCVSTMSCFQTCFPLFLTIADGLFFFITPLQFHAVLFSCKIIELLRA